MSADDRETLTGHDGGALASPSHPAVLYTLARIGLFLVSAGVLYLLGARSWLLVIIALFVSGLLSYIVLGSLRDAMSRRLDERVAAKRARRETATHAEDDLL